MKATAKPTYAPSENSDRALASIGAKPASLRRSAGRVSGTAKTTPARIIALMATSTQKMPRQPTGSTSRPPMIGPSTGAMPPSSMRMEKIRATSGPRTRSTTAARARTTAVPPARPWTRRAM